MNIPRPEHPNPQWERKNWRNLNGEWEFDFDFGTSAREKELYKNGTLWSVKRTLTSEAGKDLGTSQRLQKDGIFFMVSQDATLGREREGSRGRN